MTCTVYINSGYLYFFNWSLSDDLDGMTIWGRVDKSRICAASDINFTPRWDLLITQKIILAWLGIGNGNGNRSSHVRDMQYQTPSVDMRIDWAFWNFYTIICVGFKAKTPTLYTRIYNFGKNFRNTLKLMNRHELHSRAKLRPRNYKLNQFWFAWFTLVQLCNFYSSKKWCLG